MTSQTSQEAVTEQNHLQDCEAKARPGLTRRRCIWPDLARASTCRALLPAWTPDLVSL